MLAKPKEPADLGALFDGQSPDPGLWPACAVDIFRMGGLSPSSGEYMASVLGIVPKLLSGIYGGTKAATLRLVEVPRRPAS
jgi:hypothetical protein